MIVNVLSSHFNVIDPETCSVTVTWRIAIILGGKDKTKPGLGEDLNF